MSNALRGLGQETARVIDKLAHAFVAEDIAEKVKGLEGYTDFLGKQKGMAHSFKLFDALKKRIPDVRRDLLARLEADAEQSNEQ